MGLFFASNLKLNDFYSTKVLNVFSDASMHKRNKSFIGCYGSVAVTCDSILDNHYNIDSFSTTPASEARGLRTSIIIASKLAKDFDTINFFSDSQITIMAVRDYIHKWDIHDGKFWTSGGKVAKNGSIYMECNRLLADPVFYGKDINLYHQKGHVNIASFEQLKRAADVFRRENHLNCKIDLNFIRYISVFNDLVDKQSRSILRRYANSNVVYEDAIEFEINERFLNQN